MAWKSYTYGTVPGRLVIEEARDRVGVLGPYGYSLVGADARAARRAGIDTEGQLNDKELHETIRVLAEAWQNGDDEAGDVASSMLQSIGIEWI